MSNWKRSPSNRLFVVSALCLLILAVACGGAASPTPTGVEKEVTRGVPTEVGVVTPTPISTSVPTPGATVHPGKVIIMVGDLQSERFDAAFTSGGARNQGRIVGGYLISDNDKRQMVPGIASQWGLSSDGLTWTFTISKGVKFHDGSELTPEDVLWTLQHTFGPQAYEYSIAHGARVSRAMDRIELSGSDKVSVITKEAVIDFAVLVAEAGDQVYHIMPKRAKLRDAEAEVAYDKNPIGAGPMRLVNHVQASVMTFERFDDFYYQPKSGFPEDKRVRFQSLDMFLVPEEATRVAAIRAREADIAPASLPTKQQVEAGGGRLVFGQEGVFVEPRLLGCYEPQYPCHDKRVRQALDYAIDKELIRDRLLGGPEVFQVKGWNYITPSTIGYTPELDPWPFNPNKARQLLADAGYPGGQGFGKLIVNTYPSSSMPFQVEAAQLAAEFWKRELGLDVEIVVGDSTGFRDRWFSGELNGQVYWKENVARLDATSVTANQYGDPKHVVRLHEDPDLFRVVQETLKILDPDKRAEALKKLYPRLREENHILGIGYVNIPWAVGPRISTWRPYALSSYPSALHTITMK